MVLVSISLNLNSGPNEQYEVLKSVSAALKKVLEHLRLSHPEVYLKHSVVQTAEIDIIFMGADGETTPTQAEITAKRIMLDNPMIQRVGEGLLDLEKGQG